MRRTVLTLSLLLFAFVARAQWTLQAYGEYDYTRTSGSSGSLALKGDCQLADNFNLNPLVMIPVLVVLFGAWKRIPAIPSLLLAAFIGCLVAIIFQGASVADMINALQYGYEADTGNAIADKLLSRGGED